MIDDIVARSALLVALQRAGDKGLDLASIKELIKDVEEHLDALKKKKIATDLRDGFVCLKVEIGFDLFQSVPPEIREEVETLADNLYAPPRIMSPMDIDHIAFILSEEKLQAIEGVRDSVSIVRDNDSVVWMESDDKEFPLACIHCYEPSCFEYQIEAFGPTDTFPARVCPSDLIGQTQDGRVDIDGVECTGCMLCIVRCPLSIIHLKEGSARKPEYDQVGSLEDYAELTEVTQKEKKELTSLVLGRVEDLLPMRKFEYDMVSVLDNFESRSGTSQINWDQNPYYIWVRNCLRELGLEAAYTGSAGKLKRADVTVKAPFLAGIEVKSPAEGDINTKAIRQAVEAGLEVSAALKGKSFVSAVGPDISRGSHARSRLWEQAFDIRMPLIRGRCLLYLMLKHRTTLPQDPSNDVMRLFSDFTGWIGKDELKQYFEQYFDIRRDAVNDETSVVPVPDTVTIAFAESGLDGALLEIEKLRKETFDEIEKCFPDPERKARGGYATK